jgi:methionyl-tRNA synthetase
MVPNGVSRVKIQTKKQIHRRLRPHEIDELVASYRAGATVYQLSPVSEARARAYLTSESVLAVTRPNQWGITPGKQLRSMRQTTVFSWLDSLLGQLSACADIPGWETAWMDSGVERTLFVGGDCGTYYSTILPITLMGMNSDPMAATPPLLLPTKIVTSGRVLTEQGALYSSSAHSGMTLAQCLSKFGYQTSRYIGLRAIPDSGDISVDLPVLARQAGEFFRCIEDLEVGQKIESRQQRYFQRGEIPLALKTVALELDRGRVGTAFLHFDQIVRARAIEASVSESSIYHEFLRVFIP